MPTPPRGKMFLASFYVILYGVSLSMAFEQPSPIRAVMVLEMVREAVSDELKERWVFKNFKDETTQQWRKIDIPGNKKGAFILTLRKVYLLYDFTGIL